MTEHPDLEKAVDAALRRLPAPRAPETLVPRVMAAAVRLQEARPWHARAWLTWPPHWQAASGLTFTLLLAGLVASFSIVDAALSRHPLVPARVARWLAAELAPAAAAFSAAGMLWRVLVQPVVACLIALVATASVTCVATGAALAHVTRGRTSR
jgi:hypothetical protein